VANVEFLIKVNIKGVVLTSELGQVCGKSDHKGQYHLVIGNIKHHK